MTGRSERRTTADSEPRMMDPSEPRTTMRERSRG